MIVHCLRCYEDYEHKQICLNCIQIEKAGMNTFSILQELLALDQLAEGERSDALLYIAKEYLALDTTERDKVRNIVLTLGAVLTKADALEQSTRKQMQLEKSIIDWSRLDMNQSKIYGPGRH